MEAAEIEAKDTTARRSHEAGTRAGRIDVRLERAFLQRFKDQPAWAAVTEVFIGLGWLRAVGAKVIDPSWWSGDALRGFLVEHTDRTLAWYAPFVDWIVIPYAAFVALAVLLLQGVAAASLLSGRARAAGLAIGLGLNFHFVAAGAVNPSAFYLLAQGALVLWMVDRWSAADRVALLPVVAGSSLAFAGFNIPSISTLHPAEVIDDPALMFVTAGMLGCLACVIMAVQAADS